MTWKKVYQERLVTGKEAVGKIKSGDRVVLGHAAGEPQYLIKEMVDNRENYRDVEIVHMVAMGKSEYAQKGMEKYFRHNSLFVGATTREAVKENRASYTPTFLSEIPNLFRNYMEVDVALVQVSPPDKHGYCSLGISVDYTRAAADEAKILIAQANSSMPRTFGDATIHVSDIDYIVEKDEPLITLPKAKIGEVEEKIGENVASLISDGDTLQLGIGSIPDAILKYLTDKKDLGIHSEMISDGVVDLIEAGVITNKRKNFNPGKTVLAFLMGGQKLYDYVDDNPSIIMKPVDYTNNPTVVMQNDNMISINSCVEVDLAGQVMSTSIGKMQISGVGGQVDFVRGASMSKGGKAIIAMPSSVKGKISKIVTSPTDGAAVTTTRNDVDYIVTEYGIAQLKGKTLEERADALIKIAHPNFREELREYADDFFKCP